MEDYYEILGCSHDADHRQLKNAYQKMSLKHHPDKQMSTTVSDSTAACDVNRSSGAFVRINRAWTTLSDPEMKAFYDATWKQRCIAQKWPVQDDVDVDDLDYDSESDRHELECRCGGRYTASTRDLEFKVDYVCCDSCSLCVHIRHTNDSLSLFRT